MKRLAVTLTTYAVMFTTTAYAGIFDTIKGIGGSIGWTSVALILSGLIAIGGVATKAKWLSKILIAVGTLLSNIGLSLQDGKIDASELKRAREDIQNIRDALKGK